MPLNESTHDDHPAPDGTRALDLDALRERLRNATGPEYWRSLDELADNDEFRRLLHDEFPGGVDPIDGVSRRNFVKLMGASLALAGVTACTRQPTEKIVPYVRQPEEIVPGKPLYFATAMPLPGHAMPLLVESHEGGRRRSRETPTTRPISARRMPSPRRRSSACTTRTGRRPSPCAANIEPWGTFLTQIKSAVEASRAQGGGGPAPPHRQRHLADARRAAPAAPGGVPEPEVAPVGAGGPRPGVRRRAAGVRRVRRRALPARQGRRHPRAGRRFPGVRRGQPPLCARVREPAARDGRQARDEPPLRGGGDALTYRVDCRPPLPLQAAGVGAFARALAAAVGCRLGDPPRRGSSRRSRRGSTRSCATCRRTAAEPGDRRRRTAGGGACAGPRDQPGARATSARRWSSPSPSKRDPVDQLGIALGTGRTTWRRAGSTR